MLPFNLMYLHNPVLLFIEMFREEKLIFALLVFVTFRNKVFCTKHNDNITAYRLKTYRIEDLFRVAGCPYCKWLPESEEDIQYDKHWQFVRPVLNFSVFLSDLKGSTHACRYQPCLPEGCSLWCTIFGSLSVQAQKTLSHIL